LSAIGLFDSGVGGLTVFGALRQALPGEDIIYLGDTARLPYGSKSAVTVIRYSRQIAAFLLDKGIKYLVIACNTASAYAIEALREEVSIPMMGVVEPGAAIAASSTECGKVAVIGTLGTVTSGAYHRALHALDPALAVFGQPCPLLVPLAEEGWVDHPVTAQVVRHYLTELRLESGDLDTIVLGCTHYPLLKEPLAQQSELVFGHPLTLVDSAVAVSQAVHSDLRQRKLESPSTGGGTDEFFFTDVNRFSEIAQRFLGREMATPRLADL
jgi:glutamate racemase